MKLWTNDTKKIMGEFCLKVLVSLYNALFYVTALLSIVSAVWLLLNVHTVTVAWGAVAAFLCGTFLMFGGFYILYVIGEATFKYERKMNKLEEDFNELEEKYFDCLRKMGDPGTFKNACIKEIEDYGNGNCSGYCSYCGTELRAPDINTLLSAECCEHCGARFVGDE